MIEVIISIAILTVGLFGSVRVFPVGLQAAQRAAQASLAALVAQSTLESLKLKSWEELLEGETTSEEENFGVRVVVDQPVVEGLVEPSRVKRMVVTVSWTQDGRTRALTMASYVRRPL